MAEGTLQIRSWSGNQISIDPAKISANGGLEYPRLIIPVKLDLNPIKESDARVNNYIILDTKAELFLTEKKLKISDSISGSYPYKVFAERLTATYSLEFPLNHRIISKMEEYRGDNLTLQINLRFTIGIYEQNFISSIDNSYSQIALEIEQSYWVKNILPALNFGEYFIIEIPKGDKLISEAWEYILRADDCYGRWDTKGVFANCREMGTLLDKVVREKLSNNPNLIKWERSYSKFSYFVSLFLHVEDVKGNKPEGKVDVNKNDAEHILINSKALLKYAEELIKNNISFM
jgi:hypothetical protein